MSRVSLLGLLATLSVVTWSTPAQARNIGGVIGYATNSHQEPPKGFESWCKFTKKIPCHCPPPTVTNFDTAIGCSNKDQEWADKDAENTCDNLCAQAAENSPRAGGNNNTGGVVRPGGSTGGGVTLTGAGTLVGLEAGGYVGFVPSSLEPIGHASEKEWLAEVLVQHTAVPWVFLEGMGDSVRWEDPKGLAAFIQTYWSHQGAPAPIGQCPYSVQRACPLEDVKAGDSLQVCSGESEEDARHIARTSCAPLRYDALRRTWESWAVYGIRTEGPYRAPSATVRAVGPQQFIGYVPSSLKVVGPHEDWAKLADELLESTAGTAVWLTGPASFYEPKE
ncbi:hypothetical protein [Myxococcus qinghaiensis]|uniref:hypothetical protein n=1 Tax=Myxococcus qinghaiensis TaxID=2906758 RepID=UPI0020A7CA6D|nr:hypothetical protein [Myxococcus qinghaiensis]MCP3169356.1 hypothetical protein [Myxococcus qinghaiensis]